MYTYRFQLNSTCFPSSSSTAGNREIKQRQSDNNEENAKYYKITESTVASAVCRSRNDATGLEIVIKIRSDLAIALLA